MTESIFWHKQVETPIIPLFNEAIPEAEWKAQVEEGRAKKEAEETASAAAAAAAVEQAELERIEREKAEAHAMRMAELAKVRRVTGLICYCKKVFSCAIT
jgi:hypothetical protein